MGLKRFFLAFLALLFLLSSSLFLRPMDRTRFELLPRVEAYEALPPELAITTAMLGGFRGILIDVLWLRAITMKQQGQYFEMVQLYDWIGKLEPRFDSVWSFGGWDMAYNVSVELPPGEERWRWVQHGISFLRDQGLKYNPRSENLCKELAWIYLHKIGMDQDLSHYLYKTRLFLDMGAVVGDSSRANIQSLKDAPTSAKAALEDSKVRQIVEDLARMGIDAFASFDRLVYDPRGLSEEARDYVQEQARQRNPGLGKLVLFLMADRLRTVYRMEPERMLALMDEYGPLDWRTPYALAIYWGSLSVEYGEKHDVDFTMNFDRMVYQAVQELVRRGHFSLSDEGFLVMAPNYDFAEKMDELFVKLIDKYQKDDTNIGIDSAHENFLTGLVFDLFLMGRTAESQRWFERLRKLYKPQERSSYDEFVRHSLVHWLMYDLNPSRATRALLGIVHRHYWLKVTDDDAASALMVDLAKLVYETCRTSYAERDLPFTVPSMEEIERRVLTDVFAGKYGWPDFTMERLRRILGDKAVLYERPEENDS